MAPLDESDFPIPGPISLRSAFCCKKCPKSNRSYTKICQKCEDFHGDFRFFAGPGRRRREGEENPPGFWPWCWAPSLTTPCHPRPGAADFCMSSNTPKNTQSRSLTPPWEPEVRFLMIFGRFEGHFGTDFCTFPENFDFAKSLDFPRKDNNLSGPRLILKQNFDPTFMEFLDPSEKPFFSIFWRPWTPKCHHIEFGGWCLIPLWAQGNPKMTKSRPRSAKGVEKTSDAPTFWGSWNGPVSKIAPNCSEAPFFMNFYGSLA